MPTNEHMPNWRRDCPNKEYCPIVYTEFSWDCPGQEVLKEAQYGQK